MKNLYVVTMNCGDGSYHNGYTMNTEYINKLNIQYLNSDPKFDFDSLCDGDGFHYDVLTVPDECTLESLGIKTDFANED